MQKLRKRRLWENEPIDFKTVKKIPYEDLDSHLRMGSDFWNLDFDEYHSEKALSENIPYSKNSENYKETI